MAGLSRTRGGVQRVMAISGRRRGFISQDAAAEEPKHLRTNHGRHCSIRPRRVATAISSAASSRSCGACSFHSPALVGLSHESTVSWDELQARRRYGTRRPAVTYVTTLALKDGDKSYKKLR
ncbi:unnamed protein product, partial [Ectocarpus fasciculatus]